MRNTALVLFALLGNVALLGSSGAAQTHTPQAKKDAAKAPLPVFEIALSEDTDYPAIPWGTDADSNPAEGACRGDGNLYVLKPGQGLIGLTSNGIVSFLADKMTDIPSASTTFIGLKPSISSSGISFMAHGTEKEDAKVGETEVATDKQGHERAVHNYIARFDNDGTYKGATRVDDLPFIIYKFAAFDSGNLVAQGLDHNDIPRIALLDSGGQFLRYLDLRKDISSLQTTSPEEVKCNDCTADVRSAVFSSWFTPWRGKVLFSRALSNSPRVYEIQDGGGVRAVNVRPSEGYSGGGLLPTDADWLMGLFNPAGLWSLFEVDPQNGELMREYRMKVPDKVPDTVISCFFDGQFWGLRHDVKEGKLKVVRGTAQPYRGK